MTRYPSQIEASWVLSLRIRGGKDSLSEEGTMTFTPVQERDASRPGALPAFETKCECGAILRSAFLSSLRVEIAAHEAWHKRERGEEVNDPVKTYCVVQHSSGPQGGYIVRTAYDGWIPAPYSNAERLAEYKRLHAAEKYADKLNGYA